MIDAARRIARWIREGLRPRFRTVQVDDDFPENMEKKTLYVLSEDGEVWAAGMVCPCGCQAVLHLNLLQDQRPRWQLTSQDGRSWLSPSVWRKDHCGAHFWFRGSRVYWTNDQPRALWRDLRLLVRLGR